LLEILRLNTGEFDNLNDQWYIHISEFYVTYVNFMADQITINKSVDRQSLLADIADMYFIQGKNQAEIAKLVGVTRSNISRMLKEARNSGIVQIQINRPIREDKSLAVELKKRFGLISARVIVVDQSSLSLELLGKAAGDELIAQLKPGWVIGTSWGTAISSTVEELTINSVFQGVKVVQLLGALGARIEDYDAHAIVRRLTEKLDAEGFYINAPFLVKDNQIAETLLENRNIQETLSQCKKVDVALLGVGSSDMEHCSFYLADYVTRKEIQKIQGTGAIGDVCGRFFNIHGDMTALEFQNRLIGISQKDLLKIPVRIGVAGGPAKIEPIIGALRGRLINTLVSDVKTISEVLRRTN